MRGSSTWVTALWALVWLFSSVNADVPLQGSCSIEWAPAFFTVMWLLSTVVEKMLGKIFFCDWRKFVPRTPSIVKGNKSLYLVWSKWGSQWWGFGKVFNVLQSPIGRMASRPMRNIETFPSQQMYLYLSLVERKVTEFYHNIYRRGYLVWL